MQTNAQLEFINLNNRLFAEYFINFKINIAYSIDNFENLNSIHKIFFDSFRFKNQHKNLMYVDSIFPNIFIDLVASVLTEKIYTINEYIQSENKIKVVKVKDELTYFKYKFFNFLELLLFSDVSSNKVFEEKNFNNRVYCTKTNNELKYYSIFDKNELFLLLFDKLKLEIDYERSSIEKQLVKVCLKLVYRQ